MPVFVRFRSGDFVVGKIQFTGLFSMIKKSTYKILGACRITISLRYTILLRHRAPIKPSPQHFPRMNQYSEYALLIKYEHLTPHRLFPPRRTVCELAHQHICTLTNWFISAAITCPGWVVVWHFSSPSRILATNIK